MFRSSLTVCSVLMVLSTQVFAQGATCTAAAAEKKLSGAAKTSFLTKCERDATSVCEATATERKLYGAARTSFTRKCVRDAAGEAAKG